MQAIDARVQLALDYVKLRQFVALEALINDSRDYCAAIEDKEGALERIEYYENSVFLDSRVLRLVAACRAAL